MPFKPQREQMNNNPGTMREVTQQELPVNQSFNDSLVWSSVVATKGYSAWISPQNSRAQFQRSESQ